MSHIPNPEVSVATSERVYIMENYRETSTDSLKSTWAVI